MRRQRQRVRRRCLKSGVRKLVVVEGNRTTGEVIGWPLVLACRPCHDRDAEQLSIEFEHRQQLTRHLIIDSHQHDDQFRRQLADAFVGVGQRFDENRPFASSTISRIAYS